MAATAVALLFGTLPNASAQSMEPLKYSNAPIGLNFLIAGYAYQWGNVLTDPSLPIKDVQATINTGFVGYGRVLDFWGQSGSIGLIVPYAWQFASGEVFEQSASVNRVGFSDLALRLSVNFYGAPALSLQDYLQYQQDVIVGATLTVTAPSGQYFPTKLVNIGTNRWSFKPEVGASKAIGPWRLETGVGVTFFTDNNEYFGGHVRRQDPIYSVEGHVIYNFNPKLWGSVDGTYYTGGRTSVDGELNDDLQHNSRWGTTLAYSLDKQNSLKLYYTSGLMIRTGGDFRTVGIAWQYRWGAGL